MQSVSLHKPLTVSLKVGLYVLSIAFVLCLLFFCRSGVTYILTYGSGEPFTLVG